MEEDPAEDDGANNYLKPFNPIVDWFGLSSMKNLHIFMVQGSSGLRP
jgi:hypothetical protein